MLVVFFKYPIQAMRFGTWQHTTLSFLDSIIFLQQISSTKVTTQTTQLKTSSS